MPQILHKSIGRRDFLKLTVTATAAFVTIGPARADQTECCQQQTQRSRWLLLSDTHIPPDPADTYRGFAPYRNLEQLAPQLAEQQAEGLIITGDLARLQGRSEAYTNLKKLLEPVARKMGVFLALGNHDDRGNFLKCFTDRPGELPSVSGKAVTVITTPVVRLILLDSLFIVNNVAGLLGKAQRDWLAGYLKDCDDKPTVLFLHHTLGDGDGELLDVPRLFDLVRPITKVKAIVFGHSHAYSFRRWRGIHLINIPALGYNFSDNEPIGYVQADFWPDHARFILRPVGGNLDKQPQRKRLGWRH